MKIKKPTVIVTGDATGDIHYRSASGELARVGIGSAYDVLLTNASATAPQWSTSGNLTETESSILTILGGTKSVIGSGVTIQAKKASAAQDGYLGKDDFAAFSSGGHVPVTLNSSAITGGLSLSTQEISFRSATNSVDGYLKHDDWITFNSKLSNPMTANGDLITQIGGVVDNLAIGSPGQVLTVSSGLPSWETPSSGSSISQLNTAAYVRDTGADGYFAVVTEGSERLRVDNTGKVGIGVEVPTSMLDVAGDVEVGSSNWMYYGDPTSNGSWRTGVVDGEFTVQKRESGLWETKGTFA